MKDLISLFSASSVAFEENFCDMASFLLQNVSLMVSQEPYRLLEIEFYYQSSSHPDPFVHGSPLQKTLGRWYFHRDGNSYRSGTFKGLDISFGSESAFGGILIRSLQSPEGHIINGSSLCVEHLLQKTGFSKIADLDQAIQDRLIWEDTNVLYLKENETKFSSKVYQTPRVGLTLKRVQKYPEMIQYVMKPYRFLTDPTIKKGKVQTILALTLQGKSVQEIQKITQSPEKNIESYLEKIQEGKCLNDFKSYEGKSLNSEEIARLYGTCLHQFDLLARGTRPKSVPEYPHDPF